MTTPERIAELLQYLFGRVEDLVVDTELLGGGRGPEGLGLRARGLLGPAHRHLVGHRTRHGSALTLLFAVVVLWTGQQQV